MGISLNDFKSAFDYSDYSDSFSLIGLKHLFEHLQEIGYDFDCDTQEWTADIAYHYREFEDLENFHDVWGEEDYPDMESIKEKTTVIKIYGEWFIMKMFY